MKKEKVIKEINFTNKMWEKQIKIDNERIKKYIYEKCENLTKAENTKELTEKLQEICNDIKEIQEQKKEAFRENLILNQIKKILENTNE